MSFALMSSGGKDSTLALDRARRQQIDVRFLVNIYDGPSGRVAFHGVRRQLIEAQAAACGLEPILAATGPGDPYEPVLQRTLTHLRSRGVEGIVFGNIHLADVREWYETRVRAAGLEHIEPLWGDKPSDLLQEVVDRGLRAVVVSVDLQQGAADFLGRELDASFAHEIQLDPTLDACGERGEYHTFVYDGPVFEKAVVVTPGKIREERNHRLMDLLLETDA